MTTETVKKTRADEVAELERRLHNHLGARIRDLQVILGEGGLVLRGFTRTYYMKQQAQHAVKNLSDLPILANEIEVV